MLCPRSVPWSSVGSASLSGLPGLAVSLLYCDLAVVSLHNRGCVTIFSQSWPNVVWAVFCWPLVICPWPRRLIGWLSRGCAGGNNMVDRAAVTSMCYAELDVACCGACGVLFVGVLCRRVLWGGIVALSSRTAAGCRPGGI